MSRIKLIFVLVHLSALFDCLGGTESFSAEAGVPNRKIAVKYSRLKSPLLVTLSDYLFVFDRSKSNGIYFLGKTRPIPRADFIAMLNPKLKAKFILDHYAKMPDGGVWPINAETGYPASFLDVLVYGSASSNRVEIVVNWSFGNVGAVSYVYELKRRHGKWRIISREEGIIS